MCRYGVVAAGDTATDDKEAALTQRGFHVVRKGTGSKMLVGRTVDVRPIAMAPSHRPL